MSRSRRARGKRRGRRFLTPPVKLLAADQVQPVNPTQCLVLQEWALHHGGAFCVLGVCLVTCLASFLTVHMVC